MSDGSKRIAKSPGPVSPRIGVAKSSSQPATLSPPVTAVPSPAKAVAASHQPASPPSQASMLPPVVAVSPFAALSAPMGSIPSPAKASSDAARPGTPSPKDASPSAALSPLMGAVPSPAAPSLSAHESAAASISASAAASSVPTIQRIMVTRPGSAPELFYDPGGGHAFNPINPDTGMFSRFPHVSTPDAGPVHATDIDRAKTAQLSIKDGTFSGPGGGAAGKKFVLAQGRPPDEYGRLNFGRENNAIKKGFVEPLSPRTVKHLSSGGAHRLANATYSEIDAVPVDARLSAALAGRYNPVASQENHLAWAASQAAASGAAASPSSMAPTPPTRAASTSSAASPSEVDFKSPTDGGSKNK